MKESSTTAKTLSESLQDYLKIILDLITEKRVARIKEIAQRKGVSMPSAIEAVRKLADEGFVHYAAREFIELTPAGEKRAHRLANRHTFLTRFLTGVLQIEPALAAREACALEHHLSEMTLERMILLYQFLSYCPKKDQNLINNFRKCLAVSENGPIDDRDCAECFVRQKSPHFDPNEKRVHVLLIDMQVGQSGRVTMLGPDSEARRAIIQRGLLPGTNVRLESTDPLRSSLTIVLDEYRMQLPVAQARLIEIALDPQYSSPLIKTEDTSTQ